MERKNLETLNQNMKQWLASDRDILVLCENYEALDIESKLLDLSEIGAFLNIQVRSVFSYVQELLNKQHLELLDEARQYIYAYQVCHLEGLSYLKREEPNAKFLAELLNCFNILSDFDNLPDFSKVNNLSFLKFKELEMMYEAFKGLKKDLVFGHEIYDVIRKYTTQEKYIVYIGTPVFSNRFKEMVKTLEGEYYVLEDCKNENVSCLKAGTIEEECSYVLEDIFFHCQEQKRYMQHVIYIPNDDYITPLQTIAKTLDVPLVLDEIKNHPYIHAYIQYYLEHIRTIRQEDAEYLNKIYFVGNELYENLKEDAIKFSYAKTAEEYELIIHDRLSFLKQNTPPLIFSGIKDEISYTAFVNIYGQLVKTSLKTQSLGYDRVQIRKYNETLWTSDYDFIYMMGQNEDVVPSKLKDGGLIIHDELLYLYGHSTPLVFINELERMTLKHALYKGKKVILTCRSGARDGSQFLPSLFFEQYKKNNIQNSYKQTTRAKAIYDGQYQTEKQIQLLNDRQEKLFQPENLNEYEAQMLYRKQECIYSPSELEMYNACPYRYFLSYGMRLKNPKTSSFSMDIGTLMHHVLDGVSGLFNNLSVEQLLEKYHLDKKPTLDENIDSLVAYLMNKNWDGHCENKIEALNLKQFHAKATNVIKVLLYMHDHSDFKLAYHEQSLNLKIEDHLNFRGRIDRGDVHDGFLSVIDYKSSKKEIDLQLARLGFNIQMLLYLEMLSRQQQLKKGAVLYFNTSSPKINSKEKMILDLKKEEDVLKEYKLSGYICEDENHEVIHGLDHQCDKSLLFPMKHQKNGFTGKLLKEDEFEQLMEDVLAYLKDVEQRCSQGEIPIRPAGSKESAIKMKVSSCPYCEYKDICLKDPFYHQEWDVPYQRVGKEEINHE